MRPLTYKLTLAFVAVSLTGIILVAILAGTISTQAFNNAVAAQTTQNIADNLADYYRRTGTWAGVADLLAETNGFEASDGQGRRFALINAEGDVIVPGAGVSHHMHMMTEDLTDGVPIWVNGQQVGTLLVGNNQMMNMMGAQSQARFIRWLIPGLGVAALGAAAFATVLGIGLARNLTHPLQELTIATRAVARGELGQEVPVRSQDEIGELAQSFNQMNRELVRGRQLRRQMTADIAHELRTPIGLILGHAEALQDGVLAPDAETLAVIHDEARRLERLVDDLRTLSLADAGELSLLVRPTSSQMVLENAAASFRPQAQQKQVELVTEIEPGLPNVPLDSDRMAQVIGNLLANALRYTPERGRVTLRAQRQTDGVEWQVQNSGPGIAPEDLPHVFDRFYRGDKARGRNEGGSGLGLAIVRSLVEAQGGKVWVESQPGSGATFKILMPSPGEVRA